MSDKTQKIDLENLNDKQKMLASQISYLNITDEGLLKINTEGLTVAELADYLSSPNSFTYGNPVFFEQASLSGAKELMGEEIVITDKQLLQDLIDNGFGDVKVTSWASSSKTGFQACAFEDHAGNNGISYRGSDFDWFDGGLIDWIVSDGLEFLTDKSNQYDQAISFFDQNKNQDGNNYIYGHSLGGNLVSYVALDRSDDLKLAFSLNGNPIDPKHLDTQEKINLFNSSKCEFVVVSGDLVGHLKPHTLYEDNVKYVKNSGLGKENPIQAHTPQGAALDKDGYFVYETREQMLEYMNGQVQHIATLSHDAKSVVNALQNQEIDIKDLFKDVVRGEYKEAIKGVFNGDFSARGSSVEKVIDLDDMFRTSENDQNIQYGQLITTAFEVIQASVGGFANDIKQFGYEIGNEIKEKTEDAVDWVQETVFDR